MKRSPIRRDKHGHRLVQFECSSCGAEVERVKEGAGLCLSCTQKTNGRSSGPARAGETLTCDCGTSFYVPQSQAARKFCSQRCMGIAGRKKRSCSICGQVFTTPGIGAGPGPPRKTCSRACWLEAGRRAKLGKRNPNYITGTHSQMRWRSAKAEVCAVCEIADRLVLHHVVYQQHVRKAGGDCADPDNSLTLCWRCHMGQHHGSARVQVALLRPANIAFAAALLGTYADDYMHRYYTSGTEPWA